MKFLNISLLIVTMMFFSSLLCAKEREQTVRLMGDVKENLSKKLTIKELGNGLKFVEENVYNPYEKHTDLYGGVLLNEFAQKYGNKNVVAIELIGLDDYSVVITKKEWDSMRIILSTHMNKKYISIKDKGPLRIVFPDYNAKEKQYQDNIASWIWMIKKIKFK